MTNEMQCSNEPSVTASRCHPYKLYDVIRSSSSGQVDVIAGHKNIYVNNFLQNQGRGMCEVSLFLFYQDASTDMRMTNLGHSPGQVNYTLCDLLLVKMYFISRLTCLSTSL